MKQIEVIGTDSYIIDHNIIPQIDNLFGQPNLNIDIERNEEVFELDSEENQHQRMS